MPVAADADPLTTDVSRPCGPAYDLTALRATEFPWTASAGPYLNNASTGPLPARTIKVLADWNAMRAQPHRIPQEKQFGTLEVSRALCARLVGATPDEIALMVNTGYGINLAARTLGLERGDVVLTVDREFPANVYPWMALERDGIVIRRLPCSALGEPDEDALVAAIAREPRLRVVAVSWVSFASGYAFNLARLGGACSTRGAHLVVDAIQGIGAKPLDLSAGHVSMLACGAQKWMLGPWGAGFAYVRRDLIQQTLPDQVSWMAVRGADDFTRLADYDFTFRDNARRFEMITLPYQDFAAMNASLELLLSLGEAGHRHIASLAARIVERCSRARGVTAVTPGDPLHRAGVVGVVPENPEAASERLEREGVVHSLREGAIRLSPHCYNTIEEVDLAVDAIAG